MTDPAALSTANASAAGAPATAGALLRQARQAAGLHIAAMAVALKVPVVKLEALESDRIDLLPDAVFARALASSVCRALKLDAAPILELIPRVAASQLQSDDREGTQHAFGTLMRDPRRAVPSLQNARGGRAVMVAVLLMALGGMVMVFWPEIRANEWIAAHWPKPAVGNNGASSITQAEGSDGLQQTIVAPVENDAAKNGVVATSVAVPAQVAGALAEGGASYNASTGNAAVETTTDASATPRGTASAPSTASSGAAVEPSVATGMVAFDSRGSSWVKVIEAGGRVVFQKTLNAGESASASGAAPLKVTVGRADLTDVHVRGQPFSLAGVTRGDGVARFEVK